MENSMVDPQKIKNKTTIKKNTIWSSNSKEIEILFIQRKWNGMLKRCTPTFTAAWFTIAKKYITQHSIDESMDKESVVYIYNRILFSHEKE